MSTPTNEQIGARAYEIYLERGGENGHDVEHWLAAEQELNHRHQEIETIFAQEKPPRSSKQLGYAASAASRRK